MHIEDYAVVGDTQSVALVSKDGSIDWLCLPRFDSGACFAALLGTEENGYWRIAPACAKRRSQRRYRADTLILETEFQTDSGVVRLIDSMPIRGRYPDIVRIVEGVSGRVAMRSDLVIRFDYGLVLPWVRRIDGKLHAIAGPDAVVFETAAPTRGENMTTVSEFEICAGQRIPFVLTWYPSHEALPECAEPFQALQETEDWWRAWVSKCADRGRYRDAIVRSLITLKALTYGPTGGIVAAGTTSLPEAIGGSRNWDYRYCWLRDSTFTLYALLHGGYVEEARAWHDWLQRAVAGDPSKLQIMYGISGERRLEEWSIDWLCGYEGAKPVRIGNGAAGQLQLDVYGEVSDTLYQARRAGIGRDKATWALQRTLTEWLETNLWQPDEGLWEVRGGRRQFTHSKIMCWVALDRAIKSIEQWGLDGPLERWREVRARIHDDVCKNGYDPALGSFTQSYGSKVLDASLLLIPAVGFLPPDDPRFQSTIRAIERELIEDGFVKRYPTVDAANADGLPGREGAFLACSFWLVDAYVLVGRADDARRLFERLLTLQNDVGLLSEEFDQRQRRFTGNFPQAFSHVALVNSARNLTALDKPAEERGKS